MPVDLNPELGSDDGAVVASPVDSSSWELRVRGSNACIDYLSHCPCDSTSFRISPVPCTAAPLAYAYAARAHRALPHPPAPLHRTPAPHPPRSHPPSVLSALLMHREYPRGSMVFALPSQPTSRERCSRGDSDAHDGDWWRDTTRRTMRGRLRESRERGQKATLRDEGWGTRYRRPPGHRALRPPTTPYILRVLPAMPASYPYCVATPSFPSYVFSTVSRSGYVPSSSRIPRPRACLVTASQPVFLHPPLAIARALPATPLLHPSAPPLPPSLVPLPLASTYSHPSPVSPLAPYPRPPSTCPLPICLACPPPLRPAGANVLVQSARMEDARPASLRPRTVPMRHPRRQLDTLFLSLPHGEATTRCAQPPGLQRDRGDARAVHAAGAEHAPWPSSPGGFVAWCPPRALESFRSQGGARTAGCAQPHGPHRGGGDARAVPASSDRCVLLLSVWGAHPTLREGGSTICSSRPTFGVKFDASPLRWRTARAAPGEWAVRVEPRRRERKTLASPLSLVVCAGESLARRLGSGAAVVREVPTTRRRWRAATAPAGRCVAEGGVMRTFLHMELGRADVARVSVPTAAARTPSLIVFAGESPAGGEWVCRTAYRVPRIAERVIACTRRRGRVRVRVGRVLVHLVAEKQPTGARAWLPGRCPVRYWGWALRRRVAVCTHRYVGNGRDESLRRSEHRRLPFGGGEQMKRVWLNHRVPGEVVYISIWTVDGADYYARQTQTRLKYESGSAEEKEESNARRTEFELELLWLRG
ncbi:hypothetical protein FB451DRAFT_1189977 [Mycena latifolia]|nr:hypothetical protein FB451DRAFT_1189977 [Mycena latifolia]